MAKGIKTGGREPGTPNLLTKQMRERINDFLENNFSMIESDLLKLEPKERVKFYIELLQYGVPKLKQTELKTPIEDRPPIRLIFTDLSKE